VGFERTCGGEESSSMKNRGFFAGLSSGCGDSMVLCDVVVGVAHSPLCMQFDASTRFHVATAGDRRDSVIQPASRHPLFAPYHAQLCLPQIVHTSRHSLTTARFLLDPLSGLP
jgi:hypothetical protein